MHIPVAPTIYIVQGVAPRKLSGSLLFFICFGLMWALSSGGAPGSVLTPSALVGTIYGFGE